MNALRLAGVLALLGACTRGGERPTSVLLLTLDTTVPEALGCYGGPAGLTPNLDRLAREGIRFTDARAVAPLTMPAHASLLTGLYPVRHAVRRNADTRLPDEAVTLAEEARERGYSCAAFVAAVVLAPEFGLGQGFELYDAPATPGRVEEHLGASRPAAEIAGRALAWLEAREREPYFLWLHFYDPHFPYRPPPGYAERAGGDAYLGEVAAMDEAIGRVLARLEAEGALERTLVVAVADHGESRGRHGEDTHGAFVFDSTLRIPLIVRLPGRARAGERVDSPVSQVDVAPMVRAALGWGVARDADGRDALGSPAAGEPSGVYFESYFGTNSFGWSPLAGWTDGRSKYVHSGAPELFDLAADPAETRNVLAGREDEVAALRARIGELCARPRLSRTELGESADTLAREIERLGYAGAGEEGPEVEPEPLSSTARPSPHRMAAAYAAYMEGRKLYEERGERPDRSRLAQSASLLERAVAANPENHKAWFALGLVQMELGRFELAVAAFTRAAAEPGGERIPAELNLAVCLYNLGRREEAITHMQVALADTIGPPEALQYLIRWLEESGRWEEAERARARIGARAPGGFRRP